MTEVYWHALTRDIPFSNYYESPVVTKALRDLRRYPVFRRLTEATIFRGETAGDAVGPYVSQFLFKPIPYGAMTIDQRYRVPVTGDDKMTSYAEWLNIQNGLVPSTSINLKSHNTALHPQRARPWRICSSGFFLSGFLKCGSDLAQLRRFGFE